MNIVTERNDLAKNIFDLHGAGRNDKTAFIKAKVVRSQLLGMAPK